MLWWAPIYCVLCAGSLICAWRRREHSIPANICAVLASSTMAIPVASLGTHGGDAPALAHLLPFGQSILPPLGVEIA
ncbi:YwiC-like family protein, partial [Erysipelatoclostridium ramosum]|nr:YwiC-like family protein [Thomasclavelia ramosa]